MGLPFIRGRAKRCDQIVAIDLGGHATKAVHLQRRGERVALSSYALLDSPPADQALKPETLTEHFKNAARVLGVKTRHVTVSLGVNDTILRQAEVPAMSVPDLRLMLKFNAKTYLQQELTDHVFDCCYVIGNATTAPAGKPGAAPKQKVLVGAARRDMVDNVSTAIRTAGLLAEQVVPGLLGPVNAFESADPATYAKEVVALVDIGFKHSTIIILAQGEMRLNRVVGIGGDRLTEGLSQAMSISYQEAENLKVGMTSEVQSELEPLVHPLGRELRASVDFFEHQQDMTVSKVFVSGGTARNEIILQILQSELMVPCQPWSPSTGLEMALEPQRAGDFEQVAPRLAVAIGAGLASF
jgi:type IV pilus assembly protein PilM